MRFLLGWLGVALGAVVALNCDSGSEASSGEGELCKGGASCGTAGKSGQSGHSGGPTSDPDQPGGTQWSKHFSGVSDRYLSWATPAPGDEMVLAGFFVGTIDLGGDPLSSGEKWTSSEPEYAVFVARLKSNGEHVWSKRFGGAGSARAQGAAVDAKGTIWLVGSFTGALTFGETTLTSAGKSDVFLAHLDSKGTPLWAKQFGDADEQVGNAVGVDSEGNVVFSGVLSGSADFGGGPLTSAGAQDIFLAKLDKDGNHLWSRRFGDATAQRALGMAVDGSEGLILTGSFNGQLDLGGGPLISAGGSDAFVARFNAEGQHAWSRRFGDSADQIGRSVAVDADHRVALIGDFSGQIETGPADGDPALPSGCSGANRASYIANGHCYSYQSTEKTYDEAHAACGALGSGWTLASLNSLDELTFLQKSFELTKSVWLGASDTAADGTWVWETGEPFVYAPWHEGEPNGGTNENCAELTQGKMNDLPCGELRAFLCEKNNLPSAGSGGAAGAAGTSGDGGAGAGDSAGSGGSAGGAGGGSPTALKSKGGLDLFVAKFDSTGRKLWAQSIGAEDDQRGWAIGFDGTGNVVISGDATGAIDLGQGALPEGHVLAASFDPGGKLRWGNRFGPGIGQGLTLATTPKRIFVGGVFSKTIDFGSGPLDASDRVGAFLVALTP